MPQQLSRATLQSILQTENLNALTLSALIDLFRGEAQLAEFKPDGICQTDPRNGDRIIYNSARARRPHDNRPAESDAAADSAAAKPCVVCQGKTTGVVDVANLSSGFTFINKNLFPILYPDATPAPPDIYQPGPAGVAAHGLHLLQWTSSEHDKDWHNMPPADRLVVMQRLAALEKMLLTDDAGTVPASKAPPTRFVSIIKNQGHLVGGSLEHDHQQISLSNVMPRRVRDHQRFVQTHAEHFTAYLLRTNPAHLLLRDYGPAVLLVPYFMRRPFDMLLINKNTAKQYLHELNEAELAAAANGWHDAITVILKVMPRLGRDIAYNVVAHTGPGAGLYFEFLPYTQETGGFEQLGLYVCQANPTDTADSIREILKNLE